MQFLKQLKEDVEALFYLFNLISRKYGVSIH